MAGGLTRPAPAQDQCDRPGYPVVAVAADSLPLSTDYLTELVRVAAQRWQVPSRARQDYENWRRVRDRLLPPEPRWADDWRPTDRHRAEMVLVVHRGGRMRAEPPGPVSGDRFFDRSLATIATDPLPGVPAPPRIPDSLGTDSVRVRLLFGAAPPSDGRPHGLVRFAAAQTPVRVASAVPFSVPSRPGAMPPAARRAIVKYDVNENGTIRIGSVEVVYANDRDFEHAIVENLYRQQLQPATQNCRPIAMTVLQRFGY